MNKKLIIGGVILAVLLVGGIFAYKKWDENRPNTNKKYTKCMEDAKALEEKNQKIIDKVDAEIEACTKEYVRNQGYDDGYNCIQEYDNKNNEVCNEDNFITNELKKEGYDDGIFCIEEYNNPICTNERYNAEVKAQQKYTERYNAEVDGSNECSKDREAKLKAEGYEEGIPAIDCVKYLGEK